MHTMAAVQAPGSQGQRGYVASSLLPCVCSAVTVFSRCDPKISDSKVRSSDKLVSRSSLWEERSP